MKQERIDYIFFFEQLGNRFVGIGMKETEGNILILFQLVRTRMCHLPGMKAIDVIRSIIVLVTSELRPQYEQ